MMSICKNIQITNDVTLASGEAIKSGRYRLSITTVHDRETNEMISQAGGQLFDDSTQVAIPLSADQIDELADNASVVVLGDC